MLINPSVQTAGGQYLVSISTEGEGRKPVGSEKPQAGLFYTFVCVLYFCLCFYKKGKRQPGRVRKDMRKWSKNQTSRPQSSVCREDSDMPDLRGLIYNRYLSSVIWRIKTMISY